MINKLCRYQIQTARKKDRLISRRERGNTKYITETGRKNTRAREREKKREGRRLRRNEIRVRSNENGEM